MKTPNRIRLIRGGQSRYNPATDSYEQEASQSVSVPCLISVVRQAKVFEDYGSRVIKVISCRFAQVQDPFLFAIYQGQKYSPLERLNGPIKGAIRLKLMGGDTDGHQD